MILASGALALLPATTMVAAEERGDRSGDAFGLLAVIGGVAVGLVIVGLFALWVSVLVQALRIPDSQWEAADQSKVVYVLLMVLLGVLGTLLYWIVARPALRRSGATA